MTYSSISLFYLCMITYVGNYQIHFMEIIRLIVTYNKPIKPGNLAFFMFLDMPLNMHKGHPTIKC